MDNETCQQMDKESQRISRQLTTATDRWTTKRSATIQSVPLSSQCHYPVSATIQSVPQSSQCHYPVSATIQSVPLSSQCHCPVSATIQSVPLSSQCHNPVSATIQSVPLSSQRGVDLTYPGDGQFHFAPVRRVRLAGVVGVQPDRVAFKVDRLQFLQVLKLLEVLPAGQPVVVEL